MSPWLLLSLTFLFAYLAYDALSLAPINKALPYSFISKLWKQDLSHLPLSDQEQIKHLSNRYGLGNLNQVAWLFIVLASGCGLATILAFLE